MKKRKKTKGTSRKKEPVEDRNLGSVVSDETEAKRRLALA